jgi:hypothetical protein
VRSDLVIWLLALAMLVPAERGGSLQADESTPPRRDPRVVIPLDFESQFDQGRYGRLVGEMIWKKLERRGRFVIPESMLDVRDWTAQARITFNRETPLTTIQRIVRDEWGGQIAIWGQVERLPDVAWDEYDLRIKVADLSHDPPRMIADIQARTKTASEIPHRYVRAALDQLDADSNGAAEAAPSESLDQRWEDSPNLITGGDFESPRGWDPVPRHVTYERESARGVSTNRYLRFTIPEDVAATTGVLYYSDYFPVEENATYRFQCRWRTTGSAVKVFIKCYDELPTRFSPRATSP